VCAWRRSAPVVFSRNVPHATAATTSNEAVCNKAAEEVNNASAISRAKTAAAVASVEIRSDAARSNAVQLLSKPKDANAAVVDRRKGGSKAAGPVPSATMPSRAEVRTAKARPAAVLGLVLQMREVLLLDPMRLQVLRRPELVLLRLLREGENGRPADLRRSHSPKRKAKAQTCSRPRHDRVSRHTSHERKS
jgi:hypothetical protein